MARSLARAHSSVGILMDSPMARPWMRRAIYGTHVMDLDASSASVQMDLSSTRLRFRFPIPLHVRSVVPIEQRCTSLALAKDTVLPVASLLSEPTYRDFRKIAFSSVNPPDAVRTGF